MDRVHIGVRERRSEPNFRDFGLRVDAPLTKVIRSTQRRWGYAALSEAMIRAIEKALEELS